VQCRTGATNSIPCPSHPLYFQPSIDDGASFLNVLALRLRFGNPLLFFSHIRGRLRVCSKSVIFDSNDFQYPMMRFSYSYMEENCILEETLDKGDGKFVLILGLKSPVRTSTRIAEQARPVSSLTSLPSHRHFFIKDGGLHEGIQLDWTLSHRKGMPLPCWKDSTFWPLVLL
jgi:hypothetical protein